MKRGGQARWNDETQSWEDGAPPPAPYTGPMPPRPSFTPSAGVLRRVPSPRLPPIRALPPTRYLPPHPHPHPPPTPSSPPHATPIRPSPAPLSPSTSSPPHATPARSQPPGLPPTRTSTPHLPSSPYPLPGTAPRAWSPVWRWP